MGLVGESGCGKSVTCLSILGLLPPNGRVQSGEMLFRGQDLLRFDERRMEAIRGRDIAMVFQDPMTSLNPVHTIGRQIMESLQIHQGLGAPGGGAPDGRAPAPGGPAGTRAADAGLPPPALGRHEPAGHDRDGPRRAGRSC